jgi:hypothetical protein
VDRVDGKLARHSVFPHSAYWFLLIRFEWVTKKKPGDKMHLDCIWACGEKLAFLPDDSSHKTCGTDMSALKKIFSEKISDRSKT